MSNCASHGHSHDHSADKWTKWSAARELLTGISSNFTFFSWFFFDKLKAKDNETERYSLIALIILVTLFFAGSSTYCHKQLDKSHQPDAGINLGTEPTVANPTTTSLGQLETGSHSSASETQTLLKKRRKLKAYEKVVLFGDGCDHVIDSAVPLAAGAAATLYFLFDNDPINSNYFNAIVAACILFSGLGSYASVRNCYVAMTKS